MLKIMERRRSGVGERCGVTTSVQSRLIQLMYFSCCSCSKITGVSTDRRQMSKTSGLHDLINCRDLLRTNAATLDLRLVRRA